MEFKKYLEKSRKSNGEKFLPKTIKLYNSFYDKYKSELEAKKDNFDELIEFMNDKIKIQRNPYIKASFKQYLMFIGVPYDDERLKLLKSPQKRASAINSLRMLGDKVIPMKDLKYLFNSVDDEWKLVFGFLYDTACREDEMLNLVWRDITFQEGDKIFAEVRVLGKGAKYRTVFLSEVTTNLLKELRPNISDQDKVFVFKMSDGREYKRQDKALLDNIKKLTKKYIGKQYTPHCFRHCVSDDTMALTEDGWKCYNKIEKGEKIFTLNLKSNEIELKPVREIFSYKVNNEEMYHIKHRHCDSLVTHDHKNVIKIGKQKQINKKEITEWGDWELLSFDEYFDRKNKRQTHFRVSGIKRKGKSIGIDKAKIIGWALSDGSLRNGGLIIYQSLSSNKNKCDKIREVLKNSGLKFSEHTYKEKKIPLSMITQFRIFTEDTKWLFDYINDKRMPKWSILQLPYEELYVIYETMMLGDGYYKEYTVQNEKRIDFFRSLLVLIGKKSIKIKGNVNKSSYSYSKGKKKNRTLIVDGEGFNFTKRNYEKQLYTGNIWCPNTINGTFIAKRNGTIFITGNSKLTHLSENGADILGISSIAGHSDIQTTNIYAKMSKKIAKKTYQDYTESL